MEWCHRPVMARGYGFNFFQATSLVTTGSKSMKHPPEREMESSFRISIVPFYPPLAGCQMYRVDVIWNKIYQGYFDFCYNAAEEEFKGVRAREERDQRWVGVEDWYPSFADYLYSIRSHVFDIRYGKEEIPMETLCRAIHDEWSLKKINT